MTEGGGLGRDSESPEMFLGKLDKFPMINPARKLSIKEEGANGQANLNSVQVVEDNFF